MAVDKKETRARIADRLKFFREKKGLSIREAGALVGKSNQTISAWEQGRGQPDAETFLVLCDVYGVDNVAEFYGQTTNGLSPDENELVTIYQGMNEEGRDRLLQYARDLDELGKYKKAHAARMVEEA